VNYGRDAGEAALALKVGNSASLNTLLMAGRFAEE
jgi:hypothetical protein